MNIQNEPYPDSYYFVTAKPLRNYPRFAGDVDTEICIIGGGYTGLSCALHLASNGHEVVLLEGNRVAWGASGRNGGQLCTGQRKDVFTLENMFGKQQARKLWNIGEAAKALARSLIKRHDIQCDLKDGIIHPTHKKKYSGEYQRYADRLRAEYGYQHAQPISDQEMRKWLDSEIYYGGYLDMGAGHLHPLNYALGLASAAEQAGAKIYENSAVIDYREGEQLLVKTDRGNVKCRYLVIACNGYLGNLESRLAGKIMPINNFVLATEPLGEARAEALIHQDVAVSDSKFVINYYRFSADKRLLFGGGESYTSRFPADIKAFVRRYMLGIFPQLKDVKIDYAWGGTLAITLNRLPHVGKLAPNVLFSLGYSGQGVALGTMCGKLMADEIKGPSSDFATMAKIPSKTFPGGTLLRWPGMVAGMLYYSLRDRV